MELWEDECPVCGGAPMIQTGMGEWNECFHCKGEGTIPHINLTIDEFEGFCPLALENYYA